MEPQDIQQKVTEIRQKFRQHMNGVGAQSMRRKGVNYRLNFGIPLTELQQIAAEYAPDYDLAMALWKEQIRESMILATMLMPVGRFSSDHADLWHEQTPTQEIAEMAAFHLYSKLPFAKDLAFCWLAQPDELHEITALCIFNRLFRGGLTLSEREENELTDQLFCLAAEPSLSLRHALCNLCAVAEESLPKCAEILEF